MSPYIKTGAEIVSGVLILLFVIFGFVLDYCWRRYGGQVITLNRFRLIYLCVGAALIIGMALTALSL